MSGSKHYPAHWNEYISFLKESGLKPDRLWAIYAARYRIADSYQNSCFSDISDKTARGYSAGIQLLLAYSAFEAACTASEKKPTACPISDIDDLFETTRLLLRKAFKDTPEADFPLRKSLSSGKLAKKIDGFLAGDDKDLQPIASAIRHLFAHGIWTPYGAEALTKTACDSISHLSTSLLLASDRLLEVHKMKVLCTL